MTKKEIKYSLIMSVNMGERAGLTGSEKWVTEGAFHLSELTGQTIANAMRISILIKSLQPDQSNPK